MQMNDLIPKTYVKLRDVEEFEISIAPTNKYYYAYSKEHDLRVEGDNEEEVIKSIKKMINRHGELLKFLLSAIPRKIEAPQAFFYFADSRFKDEDDKIK